MSVATPWPLRARAELELRRRQREQGAAVAARPIAGLPSFPAFGEWIAQARPEVSWQYAHFRRMQEVLDQVTAGELRRVIFQVAIRHGKSEHNTIGYSAYRIERLLSTRVLVGSYNDSQAKTFSRQIRRLVRARGVELDRDSEGHWETTQGGGVRAVGAGAGVASVNADLIDIDDPFGSREDAESPAHRDRVWDWFTNDILARAEPHTAVILTASRWHQDDVIGRIRDRHPEGWHLVDLPGRAETNDQLGRAPGTPLWPELRGEAWLTEKRVELGEYGFASLIQGRPRPREGGMFKYDWWQLLEEVPAVGPMVRYWDLAGTDAERGRDPDYSVGALLCRMVDGRTAVVDIERFRKSVGARDSRIMEVAKADLRMYPGRVRWWFEREAGIAGKDRTAALMRSIQNLGMPCFDEPATGSKTLRAEPLASKAEARNVYLCPGEWRNAFRDEMSDFPGGVHDDQCLIGETEVVTPEGAARLDSIVPGDVVLGGSGWVKVLAAGCTGHEPVISNGPLTGTAHHPVFADRKWVPLSLVDDTMLILMPCAQLTDVPEKFSPAASAGCTTSASTAVRPSAPLFRCGTPLGRLVRWRDVTLRPTPAACATSTTRDGVDMAIRRSFTRPSAGPSGLSRSSSTASYSGAIRTRPIRRIASTSSPVASTFRTGLSRFTEKSGRHTSERSPAASRSTIKTAIRRTTSPEIWSLSAGQSTNGSTPALAARAAALPNSSPTSNRSGTRPRSGTGHPRGARGTDSTPGAPGSARAVFNLTTEDGTYFANGVLVHNCDAAAGADAKLAIPAAAISFTHARI